MMINAKRSTGRVFISIQGFIISTVVLCGRRSFIFLFPALLAASAAMLLPSGGLMAEDAAYLSQENTIPLEQAYELYRNGGAIFVDARKETDYKRSHIPKTLNIEPGRLKHQIGQISRFKNNLFIIYCFRRGGVATSLANEMRSRGITNFRLMGGHWVAWTKAGYPTTSLEPLSSGSMQLLGMYVSVWRPSAFLCIRKPIAV